MSRLARFSLPLALLVAVPARAGLPSQPVEQWRWDGDVDDPLRPSPAGSPLVVQLTDDDGNGRIDSGDSPDVVFFHWGLFATPRAALTALDGETGRRLWVATHPTFFSGSLYILVAMGSLVAAGDVDGDGLVELVATDGASIFVFEHDGSFGWSRALPTLALGDGQSVGLADMDQDGVPEITLYSQVLSADGGSLSWAGAPCPERTCTNGFSQAADIRPDVPGLELVVGNTCYDARGNVLWTNPDVPVGATAIGDLDGDTIPEIVLSANTHQFIHVLDPFGNEITPPTFVPGSATVTQPIVADLDADGLAEVAVPCGRVLQAFDWSGGFLVPTWSAPIIDESCCADGTAYDFDGDTSAEIVYRDEDNWMVIGCEGQVLSSIPFPSATAMENPVVANIDRDPAAEVIVSGLEGIGSDVNRVIAYEVPGSVPPRAIWNQKTYHVTNVNDDGTIPRVEAAAWTTNESWHAQVGPAAPAGLDFDQARAIDRPCGLGVLVQWDEALLGGAPAAVEYDVYRSDAAGGATCADALTHAPLATGLTELEWLDLTTQEGGLYAYVVVARILDPCGPPDASACTEPAIRDVGIAAFPDMLGWPLRARHVGHDVTFTWSAARPLLTGEHFHLKRALDSPLAPFILVNGEGDVTRAHREVEMRSRLQFFDLRAANECEEESGDDEPPGYD